MQPIIQFTDVCFSYEEQEVLHNVSFGVEPNCFVGVVGPNGGGKTTLLRLLLGLEKPDRGKVTVFGKHPSETRKEVAYVMQHMHYDPKFPASVLDIVLMGRIGIRRIGMYGADDKKAAAAALEKVGLPNYETRGFARLSGGQQQRVLIAQALSGEPRLLLLDEPTANIDQEGEKAIHAMLTDLRDKLTIVSVSHNVNTVLSTVTHVLCVNGTAVLNPISELHPDTIARTYGDEMAVLRHAYNCHIFDSSRTKGTPHRAQPRDKGFVEE